MSKGRIRVRLKSYDHRVIDESCEKIIEVALASGAKLIGPIPLPSQRKLISVISSPHTDKNSQEHFQVITHKRLIDLIEPTERTIDSLMHLSLPAGVDIELKM
jgi:small subunit ribosomal protein S10